MSVESGLGLPQDIHDFKIEWELKQRKKSIVCGVEYVENDDEQVRSEETLKVFAMKD